tara:strand:- start:9183 stop:9335 length:153 start_codon:yes stop_codon:yes gene_type:complete
MKALPSRFKALFLSTNDADGKEKVSSDELNGPLHGFFGNKPDSQPASARF